MALIYSTGVNYCLICNEIHTGFVSYGTPPKIGKCPVCSAKPRNRTMALLLKELGSSGWTNATQVLEIGASKFQLERLSGPEYVGSSRYSVVDVRSLSHHQNLPEGFRFIQTGADSLPFESEEMDVILCNYVLQDAPDYESVLREIHRCLKPEGWGMVNVAFFGPKTQTAAEIKSQNPTLSKEYFDMNGNQFLFGLDFLDTLLECGFCAHLFKPQKNLSEELLNTHGLKRDQEVLILTKSEQRLDRISDQIDGAFSRLPNLKQLSSMFKGEQP